MGVYNTNNDPSNTSDPIRRGPDGFMFALHAGWHDAKGTR